MDTSFAAVSHSVQSASDAVIALVDDPEMESLAQFERALWTALLALGQALVAQFLAHHSVTAAPNRVLDARRFSLHSRGDGSGCVSPAMFAVPWRAAAGR